MFDQIYKTQKDTYVVGRTSFFNKMLTLLTDPGEKGAFLFGQPCIGKTSALLAFCAFIHQKRIHIPVYIDPQTLENKSINTIISEIMVQCAAQMEIPYEISDNPVNDFTQRFLDTIHEQLSMSDQRLIVCIDEFDLPLDSFAIHPFYVWLKTIPFNENIFFILTGGQVSSDLSDIYLPYFSKFQLFQLTPMSSDETLALVRYVERNNSIQWPEKIVATIHKFSGGYPLIIDAVCREFRTLPYAASPEQTFSGVMVRYDKTIGLIWEKLTIDQKLVAACLAEADQCLTRWQIEKHLNEIRSSLYYKRLNDALQMLEIWQIIFQDSRGYYLTCAFFSAWVRQNCPVQTILENVDATPLVSDYLYQAASHLFHSNRILDALKVGQHIISIHPKHIEANQMVADILVDQNQCIQAQKILEQLHKIKPDAAKTRLINALKIQANSLETLYAYSVDDYRHSPANEHLKNIKLRYADPKDQNNHLLIVYEKILDLEPAAHEIHDKYIQLILKHQKVKDFQRKIAYEKDILSHELNAYLLTEATNKVKQLQNRILFSQIYLKALDALLSGQSHNASDLFLRVVYMDEKCKDARRFLYLSRNYTDEVKMAIKQSLTIKKISKNVSPDEKHEHEISDDRVSGNVSKKQRSNILLWLFLLILVMVAIYVMMDGSLK
jgi:tetratricopeptide (TPR) repeat protein